MLGEPQRSHRGGGMSLHQKQGLVYLGGGRVISAPVVKTEPKKDRIVRILALHDWGGARPPIDSFGSEVRIVNREHIIVFWGERRKGVQSCRAGKKQTKKTKDGGGKSGLRGSQ